jgi:hypothetical protein
MNSSVSARNYLAGKGRSLYSSVLDAEPGMANPDPYLVEFYQNGGVRGILKKFQGQTEETAGDDGLNDSKIFVQFVIVLDVDCFQFFCIEICRND